MSIRGLLSAGETVNVLEPTSGMRIFATADAASSLGNLKVQLSGLVAKDVGVVQHKFVKSSKIDS